MKLKLYIRIKWILIKVRELYGNGGRDYIGIKYVYLSNIWFKTNKLWSNTIIMELYFYDLSFLHFYNLLHNHLNFIKIYYITLRMDIMQTKLNNLLAWRKIQLKLKHLNIFFSIKFSTNASVPECKLLRNLHSNYICSTCVL